MKPSSNAEALALKRRNRVNRERSEFFELASREAKLRRELSKHPAAFREEAERQGSDLLYAYYALGKTNFSPVLAEMREHLSQMARDLGFEVTDPDDFQATRKVSSGVYEVVDHGELVKIDLFEIPPTEEVIKGYYSIEDFERFDRETQDQLLAEIYAEKQ